MLKLIDMIFLCFISIFRFPCEMYLIRHVKHHNPPKEFVCDTCGKVSHTLHALLIHQQRVHAPKVPEQCTYCGKWYSTRWTLKSHVLNMHVRADQEHRCEICGFVSSSRTAKRRHKQFKHNPEKRHKCTMCEKAFKTPTLLKVCSKSHTIWNICFNVRFVFAGTHRHSYGH